MKQLSSSEREVVVRKEVRRLVGVRHDRDKQRASVLGPEHPEDLTKMEMWRSQPSTGCIVRTSVVQRGPTSRKSFLKFQALVLSGRREVMKLFLDGEQTGWLQ